MAKIDTSTIQGYADMSAEEKLAALEALDLPDNASEIERYKNAASKANSEAADYKRKLKEATANGEKAVEASNTELTAIKEQLASLQREKCISEHTASFIAQGYDKDLAAESATALIDGNAAKLFENMTKFMAAHDKAMTAKGVSELQRPASGLGNPDGTVDYSKKIADAQSRGAWGEATYYTRLQQESAIKK
jgi:hypothetical protein